VESNVRSLVGITLVTYAAFGFGFAQEAHVKDIRDQQPQGKIVASTLCQQVRKDGVSKVTAHELNPATLEPDLSSLMAKSDEVVLVGGGMGGAEAIAPNGTDVVSIRTAWFSASGRDPMRSAMLLLIR
jgi:hypothetical protein